MVKSKQIREDGEKKSYGKRIYAIGNHVLSQTDKSPSDAITTQFEEGVDMNTELLPGVEMGDMIPAEFETNENMYMKPAIREIITSEVID